MIIKRDPDVVLPPAAKDYFGTKLVTAWPSNQNAKDGYLVMYQDGYASWSPKDVFEAAYQTLDALSFGHAIVALQAGLKVARAGWNGKGMFLYYVKANSYPATSGVANAYFGGKENIVHTFAGDNPVSVPLVPYRAYIAMKTVDEDVVVWTASQMDVLADDWCIVE